MDRAVTKRKSNRMNCLEKYLNKIFFIMCKDVFKFLFLCYHCYVICFHLFIHFIFVWICKSIVKVQNFNKVFCVVFVVYFCWSKQYFVLFFWSKILLGETVFSFVFLVYIFVDETVFCFIFWCIFMWDGTAFFP